MGGPSNKDGIGIPLNRDDIDEICQGMMYAAITTADYYGGTMKEVGEKNPWELEALRVVTGSEAQADKPRAEILAQDMDFMELDCEIGISGYRSDGEYLETTQGYIAHNNEHVVLAFRGTSSAFDWLTNDTMSFSPWEMEDEKSEQLFGDYSCVDKLCGISEEEYKPRVHTGFYNNFLSALPSIKRYVEPFLNPEGPKRKLYVVGHSLGAGVATVAACYFLTQYNWNVLNQELVVVTSGSPRACGDSMKKVIDTKRNEFSYKARMYRVVRGRDVVTIVPPKAHGFRHLVDPINIKDSGKIMLQKELPLDPEMTTYGHLPDLEGCEALVEAQRRGDDDFPSREDDDDNDDNEQDEEALATAKYEKLVAAIPKGLRDHMPDSYLKPFLKANGLRYGTTRPGVERELPIDEESPPRRAEKKHKRRRSWGRSLVPKMFRRRSHKTKVGPVDE